MNRAAVFLRPPDPDVVAAVVIFAVSVGYVLAWPPWLHPYDESIYLYESLRVFRGDVIYRDFFDITAPGFFYAMAGLYRLFGPTIETAKAAMATVHGCIGVAVYGCSRALGASRAAGFLAGLTPLAVAFEALPQASPHWVGTLLTLLLVLLVLRIKITAPPSSWFFPGFTVGTLAVFQQQKGVVMAAGVVVTIIARGAVARRQPGASRVLPSVVCFSAGMAVVTAPVVVMLLAAAGPGPVAEALVNHYLNYTRINPASFSLAGSMRVGFVVLGVLARYSLVDLFRYGFVAILPLIVPVCGAWVLRSGVSTHPAGSLLSATTLAMFALLSVAYSFDLCHLAVVSPVLLVLLPVMVEHASAAPRWRLMTLACGTLVVSGLLVAQLERAHRTTRGRYESAFGRVALTSPADGRFFDAVRARMRALGSDEMFAYPQDPGVYLLTGGRNPTRFQILLRGYNTPAQWAEVYRMLDERAIPLVLVSPYFLQGDDPFRSWLRQRYAPARLGESGAYGVFQWLPPARQAGSQ